MSTPATVPMFAPDGTLGDIPYERMHDALAAGAKMGVFIKAPDGSEGVVPADRSGDALKAGGKIIPYNVAGEHLTGITAALGRLRPEAQYDYEALPGSFEGKPENVGDYIPNTVGEVGGGVADIAKGKIAGGAHRVISGASNALLPVAPFAAAAAPVATGLSIAGGMAGQSLATKGAQYVGATPDQAALAGDVGGILGGAAANKVGVSALDASKRLLLLGKTPQEAYQSALKPSTTLSEGERAAIVNTGLKEGIPVTKGGLEKISSLVDDLNSKVQETIASKPDVEISPRAVATRIKPLAAKVANQVTPESDIAAVNAAKSEFLDQHTIKAPYTKIVPSEEGGFAPNGSGITTIEKPLSAIEAQSLKQGTYRALGDKAYGELKSANIEAQKALARGLKEEIAAQFPEIKALNAREGQLLDLQPILERAVNRIGNHQLLGIGTPVAAGAARAVTGSNKVGAAVGILKAVLDDPAVKSKLAIALNKSGMTPSAAIIRVNSYASQLGALGVRSAAESQQSPASSADQSANEKP